MTDLALEKTPTAQPFQLGDPVEHRGVVVCPLFPLNDPRARYLTLEEAIPRGLRFEEIGASGSVPELRVVNPLAEHVLLYDGEELVGAKQNRILNVSVLVGAETELPIPVSCVEQGRWRHMSMQFRAAPHAAHAELRGRKAESLSERAARARCLAERSLGRGAGEEPAHERALDDRRERGRVSPLGRAASRARAGVPAPARAGRRRARTG